jgi:hypothetical protein
MTQPQQAPWGTYIQRLCACLDVCADQPEPGCMYTGSCGSYAEHWTLSPRVCQSHHARQLLGNNASTVRNSGRVCHKWLV